MNKSESIKNIAIALSKFQAEVKNPANTANNPFFKSKYAPLSDILNDVRPILAKNGLSVIQTPGGDGVNVIVTTLLVHESGEWIESDPLVLKADKATAQGAGSAITYARRYALSALLGISSEDDDDGNGATGSGNEAIDDVKIKALQQLCKKKGITEDYVAKFKKKKSFKEFTMTEFNGAKEWLDKKADKVAN